MLHVTSPLIFNIVNVVCLWIQTINETIFNNQFIFSPNKSKIYAQYCDSFLENATIHSSS
jgi:hypothetical protein